MKKKEVGQDRWVHSTQLKKQHFTMTLAMKRHAVICVISDSGIIFPSYACILFTTSNWGAVSWQRGVWQLTRVTNRFQMPTQNLWQMPMIQLVPVARCLAANTIHSVLLRVVPYSTRPNFQHATINLCIFSFDNWHCSFSLKTPKCIYKWNYVGKKWH